MLSISIAGRKSVPVALVLVLLGCTMVTQEGTSKPRDLPEPVRATIEALDKTATEATKDPENGSYSIAIVDKSGVLWIKSFGLADVERKIAATPATEYRIYSITKQFTALMLLQLMHQGKMRLSDPAQECFPEISAIQKRAYPKSSPITLLQLATHTSGLPIGPVGTEESRRGPISEWDERLRQVVAHTSLEFEPGTHLQYSNLGYAVLGACLARAAGAGYPQYIRDHILQPLEMTHSGFEMPHGRDQLATGYVLKDGKLSSAVPDAINREGLGYAVPNGGLFSSAGDLARFLRFEMGAGPDNVLPAKELDDNYNRIVISSGDLQTGFGIGFQSFTPVDWYPKGGLANFYGHTGGNAGYTNAIMFETHTKISLIVLHNDGRDNSGFNRLLSVFIHTLDISKMPLAR
ncbi:MAG: serine hydrolase domain-containing protein [Candidatus Angelobacter sp.]